MQHRTPCQKIEFVGQVTLRWINKYFMILHLKWSINSHILLRFSAKIIRHFYEKEQHQSKPNCLIRL